MSKGNGKKPSDRDLRLASAIAGAITETLVPEIRAVRDEIGTLRVEHGRKLDEHGRKLDEISARLGNLESGAVGVGRIVSLEERVSKIEKKLG